MAYLHVSSSQDSQVLGLNSPEHSNKCCMALQLLAGAIGIYWMVRIEEQCMKNVLWGNPNTFFELQRLVIANLIIEDQMLQGGCQFNQMDDIYTQDISVWFGPAA